MKKIDLLLNPIVNKSGLNELLATLRRIQTEANRADLAGTLTDSLNEASKEAAKLEQILNKSWNSKLSQLDLSKVNNEIKSVYGSVDKMKQALESSNMGGAFNKLQADILGTNLQLKNSNKLLDDMATSMSNTIRWGITSSIFNNLSNGIQRAWNYSKSLDTSLNDIRIVTGKSADEMDRFAQTANKAAKELGASTTDYTNASLIYYQQGLSDEETKARAETTVKTANVTGQNAAEVSEQLTAIWNGYKVNSEEAELYIDKVAKVAATTAADLEELSTGMSKTASAANAMGVDFDNLNAMLATVISVTRESPETIGTSFRNIFARMTQLEADGTDEFGVTLSKVTEKLAAMGVYILDENDQLRDMDDILGEVAEKWDNWSRAQQIAAARAMAGTQQYSRFIALMDNQDMWNEALEDSKSAMGELSKENDIYLDSVEAHLQKLSTEAEKTFDILFDTDSVNTMTDALTGLLGVVNDWLAGMGGGLQTFVGLGSMVGNLFNKQIGTGINNLIENREIDDKNKRSLETYQNWASTSASERGDLSDTEKQIYADNVRASEKISELTKTISTEEFNKLITMQKEVVAAELLSSDIKEAVKASTFIEDINNQLKNQKIIVKDVNKVYNSYLNASEKQLQNFETQSDILTKLLIIQDEIKVSTEQQNIIDDLVNTNNEKELLDTTQLKQLKQIILELVRQEKNEEERILKLKRGQEAIDNNMAQGIETDIANKKANVENEREKARRQAVIQDTVQGLTSISALLTQTSGMFKTVFDPDLSGWDKFTQIGTTLLSMLPMVLMNLESMKNILPNLAKSFGTTTTIAEGGFLATSKAALAADVSIKGVKTTLGGLLGSISILIAAVVATGFALKGLSDIYHADEIAAEKAAENTRAMSQVYEETKEKYDNLKSSVEDYQTAYNALSDLARGTDEWKDSVSDLNSQVLDLINTYPELASLFENKDGVLTLTDEKGLEDFQEKYEQTKNIAQSNDLMSKNALRNAEQQADITQIGRNNRDFDQNAGVVSTTGVVGAVAASVGAAIGTAILPGIGTAIGAALGGALGGTAGYVGSSGSLDEQFQEQFKEINKAYEDYGAGVLKDRESLRASTDSTKLSDSDLDKIFDDSGALTDLGNQIQEACAELEANTAATELNNKSIVDSTLANNEIYKNSPYQEELKTLLASKLEDTNSKEYKEAKDTAIGGKTDAQIQREYAKLMGWNSSNVQNKSGYGHYDDGTAQGQDINDEIARNALVQAQLLKDQGKSLQNYVDSIQRLAKTGEGISKDFGDILISTVGGKKDLSAASTSQISALSNRLNEVGTNYTDFISDEDADALGYKTAQECVEGFKTGVENFNNSLKDTVSNLSKPVQEAFNDIDISEFNLDEIKKIANSIQEAFASGGRESVDTLKSIYDGLDASEVKDFSNIISEINWDTTDLELFKKILSSAGIEIKNISDEALQKYITSMKDSATVIKDTATIQAEDAANKKALAGVKKDRTITEKEYEALSPEAKAYFTMMDDGTIQLKGKAKEFEEFVNSITFDKLKENIETLKQENATIGGLQSTYKDFGDLSSQAEGEDEQGRTKAEQQLSFLDVIGYEDTSEEAKRQMADWEDSIRTGENLQETYKGISEALKENETAWDSLSEKQKQNTEIIGENQSVIVDSCDNFEELQEALENQDITVEQFNEKWAELQEKIDEDIDLDEFEELSDYLYENSDSVEGLVDNLEDLEDGEDIADDLAEAILRYDDALKDVIDNYEDWEDALEGSNIQDQIAIMDDLRDTYGDLLDMDPSILSDGFLSSIDNLHLLKEAANGSEDAYNQLMQAVQQDIEGNVKVNLDDTGFWNKKAEVEAAMDQMNFEDIEVGANLNTGNFLSQLEQLVNAAGMTADQATSYLASMGIDAEVEEQPPETVPVTQVETQWIPAEYEPVTYQTGGEEGQTGSYTAMRLKTRGKWEPVTTTAVQQQTPAAYALKVTSAHKSSGGNFKFQNASHGSGKAGKAARAPKSGGGGGGGKGSKGSEPKAPDHKDRVESDRDPYHDVDIKLKRTKQALEKVQSQEEKLFGKDLVINWGKQIELLNQQLDETAEKLEIAKGEAEKYRREMEQYGVVLNPDGTIGNYAAAYEQQLGVLNGVIDQYNAMSAEEQEGFKVTLEAAEERFEKFKKSVENYDKTFNDIIPELEQEQQEIIDKKIEQNIKRWNAEIEIRLDMSEAERDWNAFRKKVIDGIKDDNLTGQAEYIIKDFNSYLNLNDTGSIQSLSRQVQETMAQLQLMKSGGWSEFYGDNQAQALEDLKKYNDELMENLEALVDLQDEMQEVHRDSISNIIDGIDDVMDAYDQITSYIEHDMKLIQLIYGETDYKDLARYYQKQEDNYNQQLAYYELMAEHWEMMMKEYATQYGYDSEEWQTARDEWMKASDEVRSILNEAMENIIDKYENTLNYIFQDLNKKVTNGLGLEYVAQEWDLVNQNADMYLDTVNAIYGVQSLENKYRDALDNTDSIKAQQKLKSIMDGELAALREKDELTQYDLDRAELKYQIALKQVALEEAQQNKTQLRLRRDSQGNYSYQYTADNTQIDEMNQEIDDLYNRLYNLDYDAYKENLDQLYDIWVQYQEDMKEAAMINDPEERAKRELLVQQQYSEAVVRLTEQNEELKKNLTESTVMDLLKLYDENVENYEMMTKEQQEAFDSYINKTHVDSESAFNWLFEQYLRNENETQDMFNFMTTGYNTTLDGWKNKFEGDFIPQWNTGIQDMANHFQQKIHESCTNNSTDMEKFGIITYDVMTKIKNATESYEQSIKKAGESAKVGLDDVRVGAEAGIEATQRLTETNKQLVQSFIEQEAQVRLLRKGLDDLIAGYDSVIRKAKEVAQAAHNEWMTTQGSNADYHAQDTSKVSNSTSTYGDNRDQGNASREEGVAAAMLFDGKEKSGWGEDNSVRMQRLNQKGVARAESIFNSKLGSMSFREKWINKARSQYFYGAFDTGGYTGEWSDGSGKLALLHSKEIVLNPQDTENFLQAIGLMRDIVGTIGSSAFARMSAMAGMIGMNTMGVESGMETIEQKVYIEASFPGVQTSTEIETAMKNLINVASQRVHKR